MKVHQVSIVIITEKETLTTDEEISLHSALEVFSDFNKYLVISEKTDPKKFIDPDKIKVIRLSESNFANVNSYSALLLSPSFYEHFTDSEFILIYQLDCLAFKNNLSDFFAFDYVGAPWFNTQNHESNAIIRTLLFRKPLKASRLMIGWFTGKKTDAVGNGGFSLRRVDKFLAITKNTKFKKIIATWIGYERPHEDIFYSLLVPIFDKEFKIADIATAAKFSFETHPRRCFELNNHELPVGCHAWAKHDPSFWKEIL